MCRLSFWLKLQRQIDQTQHNGKQDNQFFSKCIFETYFCIFFSMPLQALNNRTYSFHVYVCHHIHSGFASNSVPNIYLKAKQPDVTSSTEQIKPAHLYWSQESRDHIQLNSFNWAAVFHKWAAGFLHNPATYFFVPNMVSRSGACLCKDDKINRFK